VETYVESKEFVDNPDYDRQRQKALRSLDMGIIDAPIVEIIRGFTRLPYCFTLQSCCGHFVYGDRMDPHNLERLPASDSNESVEYRLAYLALSLQDSAAGRTLYDDLKAVPAIDPDYVQFGCADWFWQQQVNSYVLQVEPTRHMTKDNCFVGYQEALHMQDVRDRFLAAVEELLQKHLEKLESP
jgi:hypothetical protein